MAKPEGSIRLHVVPCTLKMACKFISMAHRHHRPPVGSVFNLAVVDTSGMVRGVATIGRPVARMLDDGFTVEVNRVATDGTPNACSALYGAVARAARSLGYTTCITYTLPSEGGASLRGAGWEIDCDNAGGGSWVHSGKKRNNDWPLMAKWRWSKSLSKADRPSKITWPEPKDAPQMTLFSGAHNE